MQERTNCQPNHIAGHHHCRHLSLLLKQPSHSSLLPPSLHLSQPGQASSPCLPSPPTNHHPTFPNPSIKPQQIHGTKTHHHNPINLNPFTTVPHPSNSPSPINQNSTKFTRSPLNLQTCNFTSTHSNSIILALNLCYPRHLPQPIQPAHFKNPNQIHKNIQAATNKTHP